MSEELQSLPIGIQSFDMLRRDGFLYVDKTGQLLKLIKTGRRYFLSRPRRFGKSLTISTLDAMFSGKTELFRGLAAENWVARQAQNPAPVLRLDMSIMNTADTSLFAHSLEQSLMWIAEDLNVKLSSQSSGDKLQELLRSLYKSHGPVVVLIDEYDKPILDNIGDSKAAEEMRQALRSFYTVLKGCDEYLRFVFLTGISKFSKVGVFSAMNNLNDISMDERYGDIVGYTQDELETCFTEWIDETAERMKLPRKDLVRQLKDYYDGFCFDGVSRLYNPFSIMQCLLKARLSNYWYESGSPSFITTYMKQHAIQDPETYRHVEMDQGFAASQEIERARPESFLYQNGYLTIEKWEGQTLTLDYPNREVLDSISKMYLETVYHVEGYTSIGTKLWRALKNGDVDEALSLYNTALAGIPYEDFMKQSESLYRALFLMLLRGAGISANGELHTCRGRSDLVVAFAERVIVLEFKLAHKASDVERLKDEGMRQIEERGYAASYDADGRAVAAAVVVADAEKRQVLWQVNP